MSSPFSKRETEILKRYAISGRRGFEYNFVSLSNTLLNIFIPPGVPDRVFELQLFRVSPKPRPAI